MIKRINSNQLKPGMYVHDLNCSWLSHPFLFNSFMVNDEATIQTIIAEGIQALYIDTARGLDVADAQTQDEFDADIHQRITQVVKGHRAITHHVPFGEEVEAAKTIYHAANHVVHNMLSDIRLGKQLETEKVMPVVESITDSIFRNQDAMIALTRIKQKDDYTFQHSVSVCTLLVAFTRAMGYSQEAILEAGVGGLLHDIGKMKVPDIVLNKPGPLSEEEFAVIKSHAGLGRDLLREINGMPESAVLIAGQHHERFDGTGYPDKLKGNEFSQIGQLASIVDVYDALTSDRVYHKGMEPVQALKKLFEWSKFHFDPELVQRFIRSVGIYPVGTLVRLESGLLAVVVKPGHEDLLHPTVRVVFDAKNDTPVVPHDIDLSLGNGSGDSVIGNESPEKWKIDTYKLLGLSTDGAREGERA